MKESAGNADISGGDAEDPASILAEWRLWAFERSKQRSEPFRVCIRPVPASSDSDISVLDECMKFHAATETAEYVLDELLSHGFTDLESIMHTFCRICRDMSAAEVDASFFLAYDCFLDAAIVECRGLHHKSEEVNSSESGLMPEVVTWSRQLLLEAVATRRLRFKLDKLAEALRVLSHSAAPSGADELLEQLSVIAPTIPLLHETVYLMRSFLNHSANHSTSVGPAGYALTSLEAVLGFNP